MAPAFYYAVLFHNNALFCKCFQQQLHIAGNRERLAAGVDRVCHILQPVAGDYAHDSGVRWNPSLLTELFQTSRPRYARRFAKYAAGTAQQL